MIRRVPLLNVDLESTAMEEKIRLARNLAAFCHSLDRMHIQPRPAQLEQKR